MKPQIPDDYLEDFEELNDSPLMSMDKIEWWLLKYSDIHAEIVSYLKEHNVIYTPPPPSYNYESRTEGDVIRPFMLFLDFFHFVNEISESARKEAYFKQEMKEYHRIKHAMPVLKDWLRKNERVFNEGVPEFIVDEYNFQERTGKIWVREEIHDVEFSVDWNLFCFTLYFIKIFNELFCDKEILPDRLKIVKANAKRRIEEFLRKEKERKENYVDDGEPPF